VTVEEFLPWVLSSLTIATHWLAGNKWKYTYRLGLFNQALWLLWVYLTEYWGLLPLNLMLTFIYFRNDRLWTKKAKRMGE
jgi:hypothetical protein